MHFAPLGFVALLFIHFFLKGTYIIDDFAQFYELGSWQRINRAAFGILEVSDKLLNVIHILLHTFLDLLVYLVHLGHLFMYISLVLLRKFIIFHIQ